MTKKRAIGISVLIPLSLIFVCVVAYGIYQIYVTKHPKNVFEEIYHTQAYDSASMPKGFAVDSDHGFKQKWYEKEGATLCTSYYEGAEEHDFRVILDCYKSPEKKLTITYYDFRGGQNGSIVYNVKERSLESTNDAFLYDILLPAWFDGMGNRSRFSMDALGTFGTKAD